MTNLDFVNLFITVQEGIIGTLFFLSNFFADKVTSPLFFRDAPTLNIGFRIGFMCMGAWTLSDVIYHLFFHLKDKDKRVLACTRVISYVAQIVLFLHTITLNPMRQVFNETTLVALTVAYTYNTIWLLKTLLADVSKTIVREDETILGRNYHRSQKRSLLMGLCGCLPFAILMCFWPDTFSAKGSMPFAHATGQETEQSEAMSRFVYQFHGAHMLGVLAVFYGIYLQAYQWNISMVIGDALYSVAFLQGVVDRSGVVSRSAFLSMLLFMLVSLFFGTKLTMTKPASSTPKVRIDQPGKTKVEEIPPLTPEGAKKQA